MIACETPGNYCGKPEQPNRPGFQFRLIRLYLLPPQLQIGLTTTVNMSLKVCVACRSACSPGSWYCNRCAQKPRQELQDLLSEWFVEECAAAAISPEHGRGLVEVLRKDAEFEDKYVQYYADAVQILQGELDTTK
jgi:hypothetical protein